MTEAKTKTYLFHELSSIFPLIEGEEFDSFVVDLKEHGQLRVGILFEGKILDGRNRYRACQILKIPFECEDLPDGVSAIDYIISTNLHRRHLTIAQRAAIGLLLLEEEEKKAKEREKIRKSIVAKSQHTEGKKGFNGKFQNENFPLKDPGIEKKGSSVKIIAPKVKIAHGTLSKAKKIEKVAKGYTDKDGKKHPPESYIKEKWEEAKKGKTTVDAVYQKAKIIEDIADLTNPQKAKIKKLMNNGEKTVKQIKVEVQDLKDNLERAEIAERSRAMEKKRAEMEKLHLQIRGVNDKIHELEGGYKQSKARVKVLSSESVKKYPAIKSDDPDVVVQYLGEYYDTLDMEIYDKELKELRIKYAKLEKPLRDKLVVLEAECMTKKEVIVQKKKKKNAEVIWVEKQQDLMLSEYDKQELFKENMVKYKKESKELQEKYDGN